MNAKMALLFMGAVLASHAQWLDYRDPRIPRTKDSKANLAAPAPRLNGKPDLSGVWQVAPTSPEEMAHVIRDVDFNRVLGDDVLTFHKYFLNLFSDFKLEDSPLKPEVAERFARLRDDRGRESPTANCLPPGLPAADLSPAPYKIIQTPRLIVMMYEMFGGHRQIYMDGRALPRDPDPLWLGYSVGRWEGDTLAVDTIGFNDRSWLDQFGHPHSEDLHVVERFHRRNFGHIDMQLTIEDAKTFTRPFSLKFTWLLVPDSDIGEFFCAENEKDRTHIVRP